MAYTLTYEPNPDSNSYTLKGYDGDKPTGELVIPESYNSKPVTIIGDYAFTDCSEITRVNIPYNITSIGYGAFKGCEGLTTVTIPDSVTSIGEAAFSHCIGLTSINIPNSVISIGGGAFDSCIRLTSIAIPNSVTSIGTYAFAYCSGLTSVTTSDSLISIAEGTFVSCSGITSITIPDSVTSIGYNAFYECSGLTSITIPESVTNISSGAFVACPSLTKVNMLSATPPVAQTHILDTAQNIYVPAQCGESYKTATNWNTYADNITEFPILDLGSLLMYNNKVKAKIDTVKGVKGDKGDKGDGAGINNQNLLINPDFSINQRGIKAIESGSNKYSVDRWKTGALNSFVNVLDKGIEIGISGVTTEGPRNAIQQVIEDFAKYKGLPLTLSMKYTDFVEEVPNTTRLIMLGGAAGNKYTILSSVGSSGIVSVKNWTFPTGAPTLIVAVNGVQAAKNYSLKIEWIKLEVGAEPTEFIPPLIAEELPKCQRYYEQTPVKSIVKYARSTGQFYDGYIPYKVTKRTQPTVKLYSNDGTVDTLYGSSEATNKEVTTGWQTTYGFLALSSTNALTVGSRYEGYFTADAEIY